MVNKLIKISIIATLVVELLAFQWPDSKAYAIKTASLVIYGIAGGIALAGLIGGNYDGNKE